MTAGFYWAKVRSIMGWTVVFVYADGSWSCVWWADPRCGLIGELEELGPRLETPDGERLARPVDPLGYMHSLQDSRDRILEEMKTADPILRQMLQRDADEYQSKIAKFSNTMADRLPPAREKP